MTDKITSITKITRPKISGVLQRERLFALLDKGRNVPVTWVTGPGGSGKTTLAAGYLDARGLQCLWYQMDEGDADIATFFHYMAIAGRKNAGTRQKPLPVLTPEYLAALPVFTRRYFETLCSRLKAPFTIVLDNYQEAPAGSGFHDMLVQGLDAVPEGINVTILSRNEPPPQFARMRANNKVNIIGWEDIRFSLDESREIVSMNNVAASPKAISKLHEKTEGWAAGLVLMMECARRRRVDCEMLSDLTLPEIFDYFSNDILKKIDDETRVFLLKTAFLPSITANSAKRLTGLKNSDKILFGLNGNNYFTDMRLERHPVYQYHALFREYLLATAKRTFPKETVAELYHSAALLLEEDGHIEEAASLYLKSSNWNEAARIICQHAQTFFSQGRSETVRAWLDVIPDEVVEREPYLLYWLGACLAFVSYADSRNKFEKSFEIFKSRNDRTGMMLSWSGAADLALFETVDSRYTEESCIYDRWISVYEETLKSDEPFPSREVEARVTISMFNVMALRQPDHPEIEVWEERAFNLMRESRDANLRGMCGPYLALYHAWGGNFSRAKQVIDMLCDVSRSGKISDLVRINIKATEGFCKILFSSFEDSIKDTMEGLGLAQASGVHIWDNHLIANGITAALMCEDWKLADRFVEMLEKNLDRAQSYIVGHYHSSLSWMCLYRGDYIQAREHQSVVLTHFNQTRFMAISTVCLAGMVSILRHSGNLDEAEGYLAKAYAQAKRIRSKYLEHMCLMFDSLILFDTGEKEKAMDRLREAFELGEDQRYANLLWCRPDVQAQLCNEALKAGIEVEYVKYIIRKRRLLPPDSTFVPENWPWPLKIYTLGGFELVMDGRPVKFSGKAPQKPLAMLKVMVTFGGRDVREEELTDLLWPDANGDAAHIAFKTTLSRLRKLLGVENAILFQDGMATLNRKLVWADSWAFEELLGKLDSLSVSLSNAEALQLTQKATEMYKGTFLPGDTAQSWTIAYRGRLQEKHLKLINKS